MLCITAVKHRTGRAHYSCYARSMPRALLLLACLAPGIASHAASITVRAADASGAPLEDAVAWAIPREPVAAPATRPTAAVEQVNKAFVPMVSIVQAGTMMRFPNRDEFRHHVYSFSAAKKFEIKLYAGTPATPIEFDKPGEVVLGCNIHDAMVGYVYVVESPYFGKSGRDGLVRLENLPPGDYEVRAAHYLQLAPLTPDAVKLRSADANAAVEFSVPLKPRPRRLGEK